MNKHAIVKGVCRLVNQYFHSRVYLGGSYALEQTFPGFEQDASSDIDIFILSPKTNVATLLMDLPLINLDLDYSIVSQNYEMDEYSILPSQWARVVVKYDELKIDLIFLDTSLTELVEHTSCDISKLYSKVLTTGNSYLDINDLVMQSAKNISEKICYYNKDLMTTGHFIKIKTKCTRFGLKFIDINSIKVIYDDDDII